MIPWKQNNLLLEPVTHVTQSRPFSIHHTIMLSGSELILYLHWHSEIEFLYIKEGEALFTIEDQDYHLKTGDAIFIPPNLLHTAKSLNGSACEFYAVVFAPSFLLNTYANPHYARYLQPFLYYNFRCSLHLTQSIAWQKNILVNLNTIFHFSIDNIEHWELQMHGILLISWQLLYNHHLSKIEITKNFVKLSEQLETVIDYIHNTYMEDITLKCLANISHLSEGQFCRLFKQLTNLTPFTYINRYRILKSCEYLSQTSKKVSDIATLCGFNNISYYNREFIKIMKITPSSYRKTSQ